MYLPISVTEYVERCSAECSGTTTFSSSTATKPPRSILRKISPPRSANALRSVSGPVIAADSAIGGATPLWKQATRAALNEKNQKHEHEDLRKHRSRIGLEQFIDDAESI